MILAIGHIFAIGVAMAIDRLYKHGWREMSALNNRTINNIWRWGLTERGITNREGEGDGKRGGEGERQRVGEIECTTPKHPGKSYGRSITRYFLTNEGSRMAINANATR